MKYLSLAVLALIGTLTTKAEATTLEQKSTHDDIWADTLEAGLDASVYLKDSPKGYTEKEKPKPDPRIAQLKILKEKEKQREL